MSSKQGQTTFEVVRARLAKAYTAEAAAAIVTLTDAIETSLGVVEEVYESAGVSERMLQFRVCIWGAVKHGCDELRSLAGVRKQEMRAILKAAALLAADQCIAPFVPVPSGRFKVMRDSVKAREVREAHAIIGRSWRDLASVMDWKSVLPHGNRELTCMLKEFVADTLSVVEHERTVRVLAHKRKKPRLRPY